MEAVELISRCKAGERQALHLLYQQYKPKLLKICRHYTKDQDVAEDLLHDAFVIILTSLEKLENPEKLESWMATIVRNTGYHYCEHLKKEQAAIHQMVNEAKTADIDLQQHDTLIPDYDQLQSLVSQLPEGCQQVFRLSVFEGLSHQEISQLLSISPGTSSSQLFHARQMLQALIKQSWLLILLLIAIPTAIWKLIQHKESEELSPTARKTSHKPQQAEPAAENPHDEPIYASIDKKAPTHPARYRTEAVILPDSIPYQTEEEQTEVPTETQAPETDMPKDTIIYQSTPQPTINMPTPKPVKADRSWNISVAYNGMIGQQNKYIADATIGNGSFDAGSNTMIPNDYAYSNWIGYNAYLNNIPYGLKDAETRSLMDIAAQNTGVNNGDIHVFYKHQLPITIQLSLSREFSRRLSLETGLSYTQLRSTFNTGSSLAYIQERQRIHYLGIPLRFGWRWYSTAHLSLYSSAGAMLELPIYANTEIRHINNGQNAFQKDESLNVPCQFSTTLGIGLQYDFTPHLGIYLEPNLHYFFNDGSDIKTYRSEHPLQITLPIGLRFHW